MPRWRKKFPWTVVHLGKFPSVPSGPVPSGCSGCVPFVSPHSATAVAPVERNVLCERFAPWLNPDSITAFPSRRISSHPSTVAFFVPAKKSAADRCNAQSPPLGTPCGSRNVSAAPVKVSDENVTPVTGAACVPRSSKSVFSTECSRDDAAGGGCVRVELQFGSPAQSSVAVPETK